MGTISSKPNIPDTHQGSVSWKSKTSSGLFPFSIEDKAFQIRLPHQAKALPMAYIKASHHYLSDKMPAEAKGLLRTGQYAQDQTLTGRLMIQQ